jgi:hypothetical protein
MLELRLRRARAHRRRQFGWAIMLGVVAMFVAVLEAATAVKIVLIAIASVTAIGALTIFLGTKEDSQCQELEDALAVKLARERPLESLRGALPPDYITLLGFAGTIITPISAVAVAVIHG